jgi:hypothetical protein
MLATEEKVVGISGVCEKTDCVKRAETVAREDLEAYLVEA